MFTCANCSALAKYTHRINGDLMTHFCEEHLPHFLYADKVAGLLTLFVPAVEVEKPSKKKKDEPVVEESAGEAVEESTDADN